MKVIDHRRSRARPVPSLDSTKLAKGLSGPGMDTRRYFSAGTIGSYDQTSGDFNTTAPESVFVSERGVICSVRLEPTGEVISARVGWLGAGRFGSMLVPVRPGDEVLVSIPDGDLNHPSVAIVGLLSNETVKIPTDWNNDRVLFDLNVPFQVRAPAIDLDSPNLVLNGRGVRRSQEGL